MQGLLHKAELDEPAATLLRLLKQVRAVGAAEKSPNRAGISPQLEVPSLRHGPRCALEIVAGSLAWRWPLRIRKDRPNNTQPGSIQSVPKPVPTPRRERKDPAHAARRVERSNSKQRCWPRPGSGLHKKPNLLLPTP